MKHLNVYLLLMVFNVAFKINVTRLIYA